MNTKVCSVTSEPFRSSSAKKDFTFVKLTSQLLGGATATTLRWFASDTAHFCDYPYNICGDKGTFMMTRGKGM